MSGGADTVRDMDPWRRSDVSHPVLANVCRGIEASIDEQGWDRPATLWTIRWGGTDQLEPGGVAAIDQHLAAMRDEHGADQFAAAAVAVECALVLEGAPFDVLVGYRVEPDVDLVMLVTEAWIRVADAGDDADRTECRFALLMDRTGAMVSMTRIRGFDLTADSIDEKAGRVPDALRRCLGVPTSPPVSQPGWLLGRMWFAGVYAAVLAGVADQYSVDEVVEGVDPTQWFDPMPATFAEIAGSGLLDSVCPSHMVAWMDEGMLERHLDAELTPQDVTYGFVVEAGHAAIADRVRVGVAARGWEDCAVSTGAERCIVADTDPCPCGQPATFVDCHGAPAPTLT